MKQIEHGISAWKSLQVTDSFYKRQFLNLEIHSVVHHKNNFFTHIIYCTMVPQDIALQGSMKMAKLNDLSKEPISSAFLAVWRLIYTS